ncbi:efflux RND transporter periplasmic adaptor subunit [Eisenibacter elegans]|uniref:efflux RND transporter periplasmic adaptor subunit n=1 Tax=Eisenibacter elegans TaxID=997 RepID=UPI0004086579|nr:efflux RND transporter periplasmic adaptor subunit [Eisenibacter elegans]
MPYTLLSMPMKTMQVLKKYPLLLSLAFLAACGGGANDLESKKNQLRDKKKALEQLQAEISQLERDIVALDPSFKLSADNSTLVSVIQLSKGDFVRYNEARGRVETDQNVMVTPETAGVIKQILVREGQSVGAGQILVTQDSEVLQRSMNEVTTALELANVTYERQAKLWEQNIGTELQYLQAKNQKERLEKQLQTLKAQVNMTAVKAPFSGVVDEIIAKVGEAASPGVPLLRLVSLSNMRVNADVPESLLGKVKVGDKVRVSFPSIKREVDGQVVVVGQIINPDSRSFRIEVAVGNVDNLLKPDLLAVVKIQDETKPDVIIIPTNLIQREGGQEFVYIAAQDDQKQPIAKKVMVERGETYDNKTYLKSGLKGDEQLIEKGFRDVTDGAAIKIGS